MDGYDDLDLPVAVDGTQQADLRTAVNHLFGSKLHMIDRLRHSGLTLTTTWIPCAKPHRIWGYTCI
jgi:hypothetical protein